MQMLIKYKEKEEREEGGSFLHILWSLKFFLVGQFSSRVRGRLKTYLIHEKRIYCLKYISGYTGLTLEPFK